MLQQHTLQIQTPGRGTQELTYEINQWLKDCDIEVGTCNIFVMHTSASLMLCENADPYVREDLETFMSALVPDGDPIFIHTAEGPDDMPAHVRSVLTQNSITVPVNNQRLLLGTWQGIYLWEHRTAPHNRKIVLTLMGE